MTRFANFEALNRYLKHLEKFGMIFGLDQIRAILASIGSPQNAFRSIHIAGSNGKGSTAAMIHRILSDAGFRCGLYTSPHLQRFSERFRIGEREITREELLKYASHVREGIETQGIPEGFTYFDFTTALAFDYFADQGVDFAVVETGLGGRLDSTNVLNPVVSIVTPVSLEHVQILGDTIESIAAEKAGIIKPGIPVVIGRQEPAALRVLLKKAHEVEAPVLAYGRDFTLRFHGRTFSFRKGPWHLDHLRVSLLGRHQQENAGTALGAISILKQWERNISDETIRHSLAHVSWPGRGELFVRVGDVSVRLMLDGAHNPQGADILARTLRTLSYHRLHVMIGILGDKDVEAIAERLLSLADHVVVVTPQNERAPRVDALTQRIQPYLRSEATLEMAGSIARGLPLASQNLKSGDLLVVTGSLYTVGEARDLIEKDVQWQKKKQ